MFTDGRWNPRLAYRSIVTSVHYRDASLLLTGGIYIRYEETLVADPVTGPHLATNVLKITHHGSDHGTGTTFFERAAPFISVASRAGDAGQRLERAVKRRLRPYGVVFDTYGAGRHITVRTDGLQRLLGAHQGVLFEVELSLPGVLGL
jgi:beta-lactamase superfamily II metal-dependent hydrolase